MKLHSHSLAIVEAWQEAANRREIEELLRLSAPDIIIIGPRGKGQGHELLRDWVSRAGLSLTTVRLFARDNAIVLAQQGVRRSVESGEVIGESPVATHFLVADGRVTQIARYDALDDALEQAGLAYSDEVIS